MAQEPMAPEAAAPQGEEDPIAMLGSAISAFVDGVMSSGLPDQAKQAAQGLLDSFAQVQEAISGGGAPQGGVEPVPGGGVAPPGTEMVR